MPRQCDILIRAQPQPDWLNAAGLVVEWIGYPRWGMTDGATADETSIIVARQNQAAPAAIPLSQPALIEVETGHQCPLPTTIHAVPGIDATLSHLIGLYTNLDNYNGIRGVRRPLTVPVPTLHERQTPRRDIRRRDLPPLPPDPGCFALEESGEVLVRSAAGRPLISRKSQHILLGLPLLSILARHLTAPPMNGSTYAFSEPVHHLALLLQCLIDLVAPAGTCRVAPWPDDARGVFALRHDYDRPTDLPALVAREVSLGVRPTIHVLADQLPDHVATRAILRAGAEIGLHGRRLDQVDAERARIAAHTGENELGHSAHGGVDADGWQGLLNLLAADDARLLYTELLSEMHLLPHRIPDIAAAPGEAMKPIAMPHHLSFDLTTREHARAQIEREVGPVFASGGMLTLMNHPDIHVEELLTFIESSIPADVRRMTLREVARWWTATHTRDCLDLRTDINPRGGLVIEGMARPEQLGAVIDIRLPDSPTAWQVETRNALATCHTTGEPRPGTRLKLHLAEQSTGGYRVEARPAGNDTCCLTTTDASAAAGRPEEQSG